MTKSREDFEAYIRKNFQYPTLEMEPEDGPCAGEYVDTMREEQFQLWNAAWKASRESIEVDIDWPEANDDFWKEGEDGAYATGHTDGRQQTTDAVVKALRTAGIRIKGESDGTK
ncbi:TPA: hypothetical protein RFB65_001833 [Yersinia enterocolitica]|nr:hypothetical protein [Yersinia enterocolitica]HDU2642848.1 hypothetical protein [Yersinia enterocolitica]HDW8054845.1 hypothetical protein [Yersinia enterocolitica]HDX8417800.1 hypothetical protein [Yersinia enterocolitica]HEF7251639.1 hypothetical protein [Yersinia enterocolitica]